MKIGILTFHRPSNFGANLQAYSSYRILSSLGHEVKIIDYIRPADLAYLNSVGPEQYNIHKVFVENRLPLTKSAFNEDDLRVIAQEENFDSIIVGADAVWRSPNDSCIYWGEWLDRMEDVHPGFASLSAAHMGNGYGNLSEDKKNIIKHRLQQFRYITVRDGWTKHVLNRDIFDNQEFVKIVNPDPVIMLSEFVNSEEWNNEGFQSSSYYLMTLPTNWCNGSKLDWKRRMWFRKFKELVNKKGYKLIELPLPEGSSGMDFDYSIERPLDPMQWFLWIKNARAFCGLRFHAIMSCISCLIPFYSIDSYGNRTHKSLVYDIFGLHKLSRKLDCKSKIYQLLKDTPFANNRCGTYIELIRPKQVFSLLENTNKQQIQNVRDKMRMVFKTNITSIIKALDQ